MLRPKTIGKQFLLFNKFSPFRKFSTSNEEKKEDETEKVNLKFVGAGFLAIFTWFQLCIVGFGWPKTDSMDPALKRNDVALVVRRKPRNDLQIGDVVELKHPIRFRTKIYKRETDVVINSDGKTFRIPSGHIWVEGDSPSDSLDSRQWGPLPINLVTGKVSRIIYPYDRMQPVQKDPEFFEKNPEGHSYLFGSQAWEKMLLENLKNNVQISESENKDEKN